MAKVNHQFDVTAPASRVWDRITDLERLGVLLPHVAGVHAKPGEKAYLWNVSGSLGPVTKAFTLEVRWREIAAPKRATFEGDGDGVKISGTMALEEVSGQVTRIGVELEISPGGGIVGAVINHVIKTGLAKDIRESEARIREYVERP